MTRTMWIAWCVAISVSMLGMFHAVFSLDSALKGIESEKYLQFHAGLLLVTSFLIGGLCVLPVTVFALRLAKELLTIVFNNNELKAEFLRRERMEDNA